MPTEEQTYREGLDRRFTGLENQFGSLESKLEASTTTLQNSIDGVHKKLDFTNGKIRKLILAMVFLVAYVLGTASTTPHGLNFISSILTTIGI